MMSKDRRSKMCRIVCVCAVLLVGALDGASAVQELERAEYRIGPLDLLEITVAGAGDLGGEMRVSETGTIAMQFVGEVQVDGLTAQALADVLEAKLSTYVHEPEVSVFVREYTSYRFSIMGAIGSPGVYDLAGPVTLLEALALAGGVDFDRAGEEISVLRADAEESADIDIGSLFEPGSSAFAFRLQPGDVVHVRERQSVQVYVYGQVANPGPLRVEEPVTLLKAISLAGGLAERAAANRIRIVRMLDSGGQEMTEIDLDEVHDGKRPDPPLQAGDVILVPRSFF